jgi:ApbE superfamily uncharacterized protein (UPF0280 family)
MNQGRLYRNRVYDDHLVSYRVVVKETDLFVKTTQEIPHITRERILHHRDTIEKFIALNHDFAASLVPWHSRVPVPKIISEMIEAGARAGVGPMAAVAGTIGEHVGLDLLSYSEEVIVENGGDVFMKTNKPITLGIFAARSPLSLRIGLKVDNRDMPLSVCTSSGTVGHSLSLGKADAVSVISNSGALADAAATSIGNRVQRGSDIEPAINFAKNIKGVKGVLIIKNSHVGMWGNVNIIPLEEKKVEF